MVTRQSVFHGDIMLQGAIYRRESRFFFGGIHKRRADFVTDMRKDTALRSALYPKKSKISKKKGKFLYRKKQQFRNKELIFLSGYDIM